MGMAGKRLDRWGRDPFSKKRRHEKVPQVVKAPSLEAGALIGALEGLEKTPIGPCSSVRVQRYELVAFAGPNLLKSRAKLRHQRDDSLVP
jgi:hypothetical protein